jgi:hypothetical protein
MVGIMYNYSLGTYPTWIPDSLGSPNHYPLTLLIMTTVRTRPSQDGSPDGVTVVSHMIGSPSHLAHLQLLAEFIL